MIWDNEKRLSFLFSHFFSVQKFLSYVVERHQEWNEFYVKRVFQCNSNITCFHLCLFLKQIYINTTYSKMVSVMRYLQIKVSWFHSAMVSHRVMGQIGSRVVIERIACEGFQYNWFWVVNSFFFFMWHRWVCFAGKVFSESYSLVHNIKSHSHLNLWFRTEK